MRTGTANRIPILRTVSICALVVLPKILCFGQSPLGSTVANSPGGTNPNVQSMFWADTILLFAGLLVIGLALILSRRLGSRPVEFGFKQLGLDLKADRMTFVLVVGLVLIGVGVFFRYRNYEKELERLNLQVQGFNALQEQHNKDLQSVMDQLGQFKVYDLGLYIVFPGISGNEVKNSFEIAVYVQRDKEKGFELTDFKAVTSFEDTYVNLRNLNRGERVRIVAKDKRDNSEWRSASDILIPETQIQMKKTTPQVAPS